MVYADYTYYSGTYMGTASAEDFPRLAVRASSFLDYYTQDHAADHADLEAVKMCCCALVDRFAAIEAAQTLATQSLANASSSGEVKSESVGNYSRTMATGGESAASALNAAGSGKKLLAATCNEYLAHTGLLYRGGRCGLCTPLTP